MSFLARIGLIRKITNGINYESIGRHDQPATFYQDQKTRFAIIADANIAKTALNSPTFAAFNYLSSFLPADRSEDLGYIFDFLEQFPEFLEGDRHQTQSVKTKKILDRYKQCCDAVTPEMISRGLKSWLQSEPTPTAERLSKYCL